MTTLLSFGFCTAYLACFVVLFVEKCLCGYIMFSLKNFQ